MATNITGVTMTQPLSDPNIQTGGSFTMGGQISTAGGGGWAESGDMYFEWDQGTGSWATIGTSGGLYHSATNPLLGLQTAVEQTITIYSDTADTYQVRVKLIEDDLTEYTTTAQTVTVSAPANDEASAESCDHLHDGESPALTQQHSLDVAEAYHLHDGEPSDVTEVGGLLLEMAEAAHDIYDSAATDEILLWLSEITNSFSQYTGTSFPDWTDYASSSTSTVVTDPPVYAVGDQSMDLAGALYNTIKKAWSGAGSFLEGDVLFRVNMNLDPAPSAADHWIQMILRYRYEGGHHYGWGAMISYSSALGVVFNGIELNSDGSGTWTFAQDSLGSEFTTTDWIFYRLKVWEDATHLHLSGKYWKDTQAEPAGWNHFDTTFTKSLQEASQLKPGKIAIGGYTDQYNDGNSRLYDFIGVDTTGQTVPVPELPWTPLVVDGAYHDHAAEQADVTEGVPPVNLVVAESYDEHYSDGLTLAQAHNLVVVEAYHEQVVDNITLTGAVILEPAEAAHDLVGDQIDLVQSHALATGACDHLQAAANVTLLQLHALAAADADHLQVSDNITLAGTGGLEIQAADHLHLAETAPLTQVHALGVDAGDHLHIADTVNLSGAYTLENLDADHLQTAGAPILGQTYILAAAEAAHIQAVATIELTTISALIVAEAAHDQLADTLELTQVLPNQLNAAACDHLVVSDPLVLSQLYALAVDDIDHDQLADAIGIIVTLATADTDQTLADDGPLSLAMGWRLSMASAVHLHTAASIGLGQAHLLAIQPNLIQLVSDTTRATPNATMGQVFQTDYRSFTTSYSLKSLSPQFDFNSLTRRSSMSGLVQGAIQ